MGFALEQEKQESGNKLMGLYEYKKIGRHSRERRLYKEEKSGHGSGFGH